jgi:hypothetical protein
LAITFCIYTLQVYIIFYLWILSLYSTYLFFLILFLYAGSFLSIQYLLESWVIFLSGYYKEYIVSKIEKNYIFIEVPYKLLLTISTIGITVVNTIYEYYLIWIILITPSPNELNTKKNFTLISKPYKGVNYTDSIKYFNFFQIYNFIKNIILSILISLTYIFYTIYFFQIQFIKQVAIWLIIGFLFYWLISGFNFFIKHYQFSKFTSQIQRFWKRTNTCFWLIEGFLILIFFYYFLNSSQEPLYMYDYSALNQEYLISLTSIYVTSVILAFVIYLVYIILLQLNFNNWDQQALYLLIISSYIFFIFFLETYQFYYLLNSFTEKTWVFSEEINVWILAQESASIRCKHYYLMVYLIAKYWHFLFIFLSWVFFMAKNIEKKQTNYILLGSNLQNLILLFILNLSCYAQWLKWFYRRFYDIPYKWFFTNLGYNSLVGFFKEMYIILTNLLQLEFLLTNYSNCFFMSLNFWSSDSLFLWNLI